MLATTGRGRWARRGVRAWSTGAVLLATLGALGVFSPACGSEARGVDPCRRIESARCAKFADCGTLLGDQRSCERFYDVQCGRGLQEGVREPTKPELDACTAAISASCDVAKEPRGAPACSFLVPPPAPATSAPATDAGGSDAGAVDARGET